MKLQNFTTMIILFGFGIVLTIFGFWGIYKLVHNGIELYGFKDWFWFTLIILVMVSVGPTMTYYGYVTPGSDINHQIDNHNGTMTVIEYSISGDSTVITNIKTPKETYGTVTNVVKNKRMIGVMGKGGHWVYYTNITIKNNNGKTFTDELHSDYHDDIHINTGHSVKIVETFYPSYEINITY